MYRCCRRQLDAYSLLDGRNVAQVPISRWKERCPHVLNSCLYCEWRLDLTKHLCQAICFWLCEIAADYISSALMAPTTTGSDCSSSHDIRGVYIVGTTSFRCPSLLCLLNFCSFVEVIVTRVKSAPLGIASKMLLQGSTVCWRYYGQGQSVEYPLLYLWPWLELQEGAQGTSAWQLELRSIVLSSVLDPLLPQNASSCPHYVYFLL